MIVAQGDAPPDCSLSQPHQLCQAVTALVPLGCLTSSYKPGVQEKLFQAWHLFLQVIFFFSH